MERKITEKELELMQLFVQITNTPARDIIEGDTFVIFIISKGTLQQTLQKGLTLMSLRNKLGKQVEVYEEAEDAEEFLKKYYKNFEIADIKVSSDKKQLMLTFDEKDKGLAIGKAGDKIKKARIICKQLF